MSPEVVQCERDGLGWAAFVCQHLFAAIDASSNKVGFCSDQPTPDNPWPDAWCNACEEQFIANGENWTDEDSDLLSIKLVCHHCYQRVRESNDIEGNSWPVFDSPLPEQEARKVGFDVDLPAPEDRGDEKLVSDVREYGWHWIHIAAEHHPEHVEQNEALEPHPIYDAAFGYTVGLWLTHSHHELVLVGRWSNAHAIVANVVAEIEKGTRFEAGATSDEILEGYPVRFSAVSAERRDELLRYACWANGWRPFEALQVVLPDKHGRWPWDVDYDSVPQPLLA